MVKKGLALLLDKQRLPTIAMTLGLVIGVKKSLGLIQKEYNKEAYAIRGRTNLYKKEQEKLDRLDNPKPLWT